MASCVRVRGQYAWPSLGRLSAPRATSVGRKLDARGARTGWITFLRCSALPFVVGHLLPVRLEDSVGFSARSGTELGVFDGPPPADPRVTLPLCASSCIDQRLHNRRVGPTRRTASAGPRRYEAARHLLHC